MVKKNKKIGLLLAGGSLLLDKNKKLLSIKSKDDINGWLEQMPELNILADIEPIFIAGEDEIITPQIWEKIASTIINKAKSVDGFVIVSRTEQLVNTSLALSFLLQNLPKTIIITASQVSGTDFIDKKY